MSTVIVGSFLDFREIHSGPVFGPPCKLRPCLNSMFWTAGYVCSVRTIQGYELQ